MKDFKGTILLTLATICYLIAGYVYAYDPLHFVWRQVAVTLTFATILNFTYKVHPIPAIISIGLLFLSATETIDEFLKVNTKIRMDDYVYTTLGIIGILFGLYKHRKQL